MYVYVRSKTTLKEDIGPLKDENGKILTDTVDLGSCLNNFFASVFTDETTDNIPELDMKFSEESSHVLLLIV